MVRQPFCPFATGQTTLLPLGPRPPHVYSARMPIPASVRAADMHIDANKAMENRIAKWSEKILRKIDNGFSPTQGSAQTGPGLTCMGPYRSMYLAGTLS